MAVFQLEVHLIIVQNLIMVKHLLLLRFYHVKLNIVCGYLFIYC